MNRRPNLTALGVLKESRALIENPSRWTEGAAARAMFGWPCEPTSRLARRWCAIGAVHAILGGDKDEDDDRFRLRMKVEDMLDGASMTLYGIPVITSINDAWDGHEKVLRAYDLAIEREASRSLVRGLTFATEVCAQ